MSEDRKAPGPARPPRTISNPGALKAVSAARAQPLDRAPALNKDRLKEGAADTALNTLGVLGDTWEDFKRSDRFFKYKAAIILACLALYAATFVVIARDTGPASGDLGAVLIATDSGGRPMVSIQNASDDRWEDVQVVVNARYTARAPALDPNAIVTFTPKQLFDVSGVNAPADVKITDVVLKTTDGDEELMRGGQRP